MPRHGSAQELFQHIRIAKLEFTLFTPELDRKYGLASPALTFFVLMNEVACRAV